MEVMQNIGATNPLKSQMSSVSNGGTTTNGLTGVNSSNVPQSESFDDITGDDLLELGSLAAAGGDNHMTSDTPTSNIAEELLGGDPMTVTPQEESPQVNVAINNVVCTFSTRCHLNLKELALNGRNVELKKAQGMLNMKLRRPSATASIWSSGKITITGANSEDNCKKAARRVARRIQKLGFNVKFASFRIVNVLGTCSLPFGILLTDFSNANLHRVQYEPELHPGATYQIQDIHATLKIFSTGSITITAPKVSTIQEAVERVFPLVYPFKKPKKIDPKELRYIEMMYDSSDAEMVSDNSDLDLEPGEIPTTKSRKYSNMTRGKRDIRRGGYGRVRPAVVASTVINEDDYGSDSDDVGLDSDSD